MSSPSAPSSAATDRPAESSCAYGALLAPAPSLMHSLSWCPLTAGEKVADLRALHAALFPVTYPEEFYSTLVSSGGKLARLAYHGPRLVGAVCCRVEPHEDASLRLYIMTLGVRAAYREQGIGSDLLRYAIWLAEQSTDCDGVLEIYAHVQEGNNEALRLYNRHGFDVRAKLLNYYRRIQPPHCFVVAKSVTRRALRGPAWNT